MTASQEEEDEAFFDAVHADASGLTDTEVEPGKAKQESEDHDARMAEHLSLAEEMRARIQRLEQAAQEHEAEAAKGASSGAAEASSSLPPQSDPVDL